MKTLIIVESPTKAKTIAKFLGKNFVVESSYGHIRDLPKSKMGVDIEHGTFLPTYVIPPDRKPQVQKLKALAKKSAGVIFATDEDREGEAISWHLAEILDIPQAEAKRMVFHEITKTAINEALANPRAIDQKLVDAQQARRILDRLVGYELSPFLWKKVTRGLSAGRVQSVAVRLVVEREREIQAFIPQEYWSLAGVFSGKNAGANNGANFSADLIAIKNKKLDKLDLKTRVEIDTILADLATSTYTIKDVQQKQTKRTPPPPFTTSTLQQAANQKLGYSAKSTMRLAQQLYETGLITYMRTDSLNLSSKFVSEARAHVQAAHGEKYLAAAPRHYANKSKGAQEAHEAIRPTDPTQTPDLIQNSVTPTQHKLYNLIWKRAVATQMIEARLNRTTIDIAATDYTFRATGQTMIFPGWLALYPEAIKEEMLPELTVGTALTCHELTPAQHFTEPAARYSDATLVKALEEHGIGRPSTYAPTIATIEDRRYVTRDEQKRLQPTDIAFVVNDLLVAHFKDIVDFQFTAQMEENLDEIAAGTKDWQPIMATFYAPFHANLIAKTDELDKKDITEEKTDEICPKCASPMVIKIGRFGKFLACTNYPECKTTKPMPGSAEAQEAAQLTDEVCEKCGKPFAVKRGRFGTFLGCSGYPDCKNIKKIEKGTGVTCNLCGKGEFVQKRSKQGRTFYSCNRYPDCKNLVPSKPTGEFCTACKFPIIFAAKGLTRCGNKDCPESKVKKAAEAAE